MLGHWNTEEACERAPALLVAIKTMGGNPDLTPMNGVVTWEDNLFGWQAYSPQLRRDTMIVCTISQHTRTVVLDRHIEWGDTKITSKFMFEPPANSAPPEVQQTFENLVKKFSLRDIEMKERLEAEKELIRGMMNSYYYPVPTAFVDPDPDVHTRRSLRDALMAIRYAKGGYPPELTPPPFP